MKSGWQVKRIGDVCSLMTGGTPSSSKPEYYGGEIRWLVSGDIHKGEIFDCEGRITETGMKNSNARLLPINSVMIALNGQGKTRGTVALLRVDATCNQSLVSISPNDPEKLLPEFLYTNLHGRYQEIRQLTGDSGNDRRGLNMGLIRSIHIPIPPIAEQQRIVAVLDEAFAGIAKVAENAQKNLANARELFESHLQSIFTTKGDGWVEKKFGTVCHFVRGPFGGSLAKSCFKPTGYAVYEQQHAIYDQFDEIRYFIDEKKFTEMQRFELKAGDLIMSCSGTMGKVAIVPDGVQKGVINQALLKLSPSKDLLVQFLRYWMRSQSFQAQNEKYSMGAAIKNVASVAVLKQIDVPMPPLPEQQRIVAQLDTLATETKRLEAIYQQKLEHLAALKQSILHKAFAGELSTCKRAA